MKNCPRGCGRKLYDNEPASECVCLANEETALVEDMTPEQEYEYELKRDAIRESRIAPV